MPNDRSLNRNTQHSWQILKKCVWLQYFITIHFRIYFKGQPGCGVSHKKY